MHTTTQFETHIMHKKTWKRKLNCINQPVKILSKLEIEPEMLPIFWRGTLPTELPWNDYLKEIHYSLSVGNSSRSAHTADSMDERGNHGKTPMLTVRWSQVRFLARITFFHIYLNNSTFFSRFSGNNHGWGIVWTTVEIRSSQLGANGT